MKFGKLLKTPFLTEHFRWLLLYHCKIHLYCLRILLTIRLNFAFFFQSYFKPFLRPVIGLRIRLCPPDKFQVFSLCFLLYIYIYSYFTLPYLHLIAYTFYTCLLTLMFSLYYCMNLKKLLKYRECRNYDKMFQIEEYFQY